MTEELITAVNKDRSVPNSDKLLTPGSDKAGDSLEVRENIKETAAEFVEVIDRNILGSMMYGDEYAANHT